MIIGLCGYSGAGKDTAASYMKGFQRIAFADKVRDAVEALNPYVCSTKHFDAGAWLSKDGALRLSDILISFGGWDKAKQMPEVRTLMQRMGTEVGRNIFDADIWVKLAEQHLQSVLKTGHAVFTDVRFPNEARMIRRYGGVLVWVSQKDHDPLNAHSSENSISEDDCEFTLVNPMNEGFQVRVHDLLFQLRRIEKFKDKRNPMANPELNSHPPMTFKQRSLRPDDIAWETDRIRKIMNQNGCIQQRETEYLLGRIESLEQDLKRSECLREENIKAFNKLKP